jgi:hypothetical protein
MVKSKNTCLYYAKPVHLYFNFIAVYQTSKGNMNQY